MYLDSLLLAIPNNDNNYYPIIHAPILGPEFEFVALGSFSMQMHRINDFFTAFANPTSSEFERKRRYA